MAVVEPFLRRRAAPGEGRTAWQRRIGTLHPRDQENGDVQQVGHSRAIASRSPRSPRMLGVSFEGRYDDRRGGPQALHGPSRQPHDLKRSQTHVESWAWVPMRRLSMDPNVKEWINAWVDLALRWTHVVAGIMWIGHLYFFNFVNSQLAKTYDADSKKKVVPELMPRALYFFRWGAAYTWVTGFLLVAFVYYMQPNLLPAESTMRKRTAIALSLVLILVAFFIYDFLWKALAGKEQAG